MLDFALTHAYLIPLFPALAFLIIGPFTRSNKNLSATIAIFMMVLSLIFSVFVALATQVYGITMNDPFVMQITWARIADLPLTMGIFIDPLTAMMLLVVTLVSLIGFYYEKVKAREAAKKAFITTRIGDFGMLVGIIIIAVMFGTTDFLALRAFVPAYVLAAGTTTITIIGLLLFMGAIGKSGQFPLHVRLLDAMEGPTPTSALIHAATMVAAGVFLVARAYFIFSESAIAMDFITGIGAFTAIFAACIAVTQTKFKSVLAYSTISQLGFMMAAVGLGAFSASMFHLVTHAFFKAMLFLCAGAIMHALHEETNIFHMGGLYKKMPLTFFCMVVGVLAISGIPPFSGFFSKDEILAAALHASGPVYAVLLAASFLTAFYMMRLLIIAFLGENHSKYEAHEVDAFMRGPMLLLAFLTLVTGLACYYGGFSLWVNDGVPAHMALEPAVAITGTAVSLAGFAAAYIAYGIAHISRKVALRRYGFLYSLVYHKFYIDELYDFFRRRFVYTLAYALDWVDIHIFGGIIDGLGAYARGTSLLLAAPANGQVQRYLLFFYAGVAILLIAAIYWTIRILSYVGGVLG